MSDDHRMAPRIETARLILRSHTVDDYDDCAAMWGDPDVTRHIGGQPSTREESWYRLLRYRGHWPLLGYGYWAISEKDSGRYVGELGFADLKRAIDPPLNGVPEAGWVLATWAHGRGYATEALRAALGWADAHLAHERTVCIIDPPNTPSIRVAEKAGYRPFRESSYKGTPVILFERTR